MSDCPPSSVETDPRFPSGPWVGFFLQRIFFFPMKFRTELDLTFRGGKMIGEGRDIVGKFIVKGFYSVEDGKCHWTKHYLGKHDVSYEGYNEGKGIWGTWQILNRSSAVVTLHGGFHIWPKGMAFGEEAHVSERADRPAVITEELTIDEEASQPAGTPGTRTIYVKLNVARIWPRE